MGSFRGLCSYQVPLQLAGSLPIMVRDMAMRAASDPGFQHAIGLQRRWMDATAWLHSVGIEVCLG